MVELTPVRAWHPDPGHADADALVCPVYDTLSERELVRFARHPNNAAGFVPRPTSEPVEQFVRRAGERLREALRGGAYVRDDAPAYYVYGIRYVPPDDILETIPVAQRRREYLLLGLVGSLDLGALGPSSLALHEFTFADRVEERDALTEATGMTFAPIMAGYHEPGHQLNDLLEQHLGLHRRGLRFEGRLAPVTEARLDGTTHQLWRIDDPAMLVRIRTEVRKLRLLVLDGHHRFTAARRRRERGLPSYPLTMLVDGQDRALRVLPWHRVLPASVRSPDRVLAGVRREFAAVTEVPGPCSSPNGIDRLEAMHRERRRGFAVALGGNLYEVEGPRGGDAGSDFDLLHAFLEGPLGTDPHDLIFVRSPRAALERLTDANDAGFGGTAFLLPPLTEAGIEGRAFGAGSLMAHKSTMFLPKVAEGVLFARADGSD